MNKLYLAWLSVLLLAGCEANNNKQQQKQQAINDSLTVDTSTGGTLNTGETTKSNPVHSFAGSNVDAELAALKEIEIDEATFKKLYSNSRIKKDEFSEKRYIMDKSSPTYVNRNGVFCTLAYKKNELAELYFSIQYYAEDWLFINRMIFNVDGENFNYTPSDFKRDNGDGHIWEWFEESPSTSDYPMLVKLALGKKAKVKYNGSEYYQVAKITKAQQAGIKKILQIYKGVLLGYMP
jgi:hypothetical protein